MLKQTCNGNKFKLHSFSVALTLLVLKLRPLCSTAATADDTNDANITEGTEREPITVRREMLSYSHLIVIMLLSVHLMSGSHIIISMFL